MFEVEGFLGFVMFDWLLDLLSLFENELLWELLAEMLGV